MHEKAKYLRLACKPDIAFVEITGTIRALIRPCGVGGPRWSGPRSGRHSPSLRLLAARKSERENSSRPFTSTNKTDRQTDTSTQSHAIIPLARATKQKDTCSRPRRRANDYRFVTLKRAKRFLVRIVSDRNRRGRLGDV